MNTQYTLEELLCFKVFNNLPINLSCDIKSLIAEWAQTQLFEQDVPESLMILASLGLDKDIDSYEFEHYLDRYLRENQIVLPNQVYSGFVFLKFAMRNLMHLDTKETVEEQLVLITEYRYVFEHARFKNLMWRIYCDYLSVFDNIDSTGLSPVDQMETDVFVEYIRKRFYPYCKLLNHNEMLRFLSRS